MYQEFYGLRSRPFDLTPDPRFLLMTPKHREALSTLQYAISGHKGVALLVGEAGTGKTTLIHAALETRSDGLPLLLSNPALTRAEFLEFLAEGFNLPADAATSKTRCLSALTRVLKERQAAGSMAALIIDEAQCLPDELLEEVRLLSNIEMPNEKLLSIILVGQPEIAERLNRPGQRQIKQRVGLRSTLSPLDAAETAAYIATRVQVAGGTCDSLFTPDAIATIFEYSGGIPRSISVICDNALVTGFALDWRPVDRDVILEVCRDLDLAREDAAAPQIATPRSGAA
jgi:general secretion pathway protein A